MDNNPLILAQKLIQFPSVTPIDAGISNFLSNYLTTYGFTCKELIFEDINNIYARYGSKEPNFCFAGHTDVVPAGEGWSSDPFTPMIKDGILYGRGASDMKAAIAAFICASIEFIENNDFNGSISFLITGDEEGPAINGTRKVLEYLQNNQETISACIVGEPTCPNYLGEMIKYGRRGSINFKLAINGTQGHVAYPELANNPIDILVDILKDLKSLKLDSGNDDFIASNLEVTNLSVENETSNIIPSQARANFNIRFNNIHNAESLNNLVEKICKKYSDDFELEYNCSGEAFVDSKKSSFINSLSDAITKVTNKSPILSTTGGTSDARFIKDHCQVIEFGLVNQTAHHVDEHVSCQDILNLKEIYLDFLKRYFK